MIIIIIIIIIIICTIIITIITIIITIIIIVIETYYITYIGAQDLTTESLTTQIVVYARVLLWKSQITKTMEWKSLNQLI